MAELPFFRRKAAFNLYKEPKLFLSKMTFTSDFINSDRGDVYPLIKKQGDVKEKICNGYMLDGEGYAVRLLGGFFPYADYEAEICGKAGFAFYNGESEFSVSVQTGSEYYIETDINGTLKRTCICGYSGEKVKLILSFCGNNLFLYLQKDGEKAECVYRDTMDVFGDVLSEKIFFNIKAAVKVYGGGKIKNVSAYLDTGICQADIRPVRYEDGTVITENGKIYFTVSSRLNTGNFQSVLAMKKDTCEFELAGAIFYDTGDGRWCGDVAMSLMFDRKSNCWRYWACGFSKGHICGWGKTENDPRFGINLLSLNLMPKTDGGDITEFSGREGDKDPDFIFDSKANKWYLTLCRLDGGQYRYFLFESDNPFENYKFVRKTVSGCETGASIVESKDGYLFVCGSDFDKKSLYKIYSLEDFTQFTTVKCDYPDGGFRGWGSVFLIPCGGREKYMWITFDRYLGDKEHNWSYGNIYIYESETFVK